VIFSSRNHMKTTQEIVLFSPVFCPTIGGRFREHFNENQKLIWDKPTAKNIFDEAGKILSNLGVEKIEIALSDMPD
jgi:hypothetical protein